jgi:hypothetical protein
MSLDALKPERASASERPSAMPCKGGAGGRGRVRQRVVISDFLDFENSKNRVVTPDACASVRVRV